MSLPPLINSLARERKARLKSTAHRDWVRQHRCSVPGCQLMPIEVAHVNRSSTRGMGQKSSDAFTLSLCREHHAESHRGEKTFEAKHGFKLLDKAEAFYRASPHRTKLDDPFNG